MEKIQIIFDRLYHQSFPSESGKEINGVDLVMIDADTIGIITCFLGNKGKLSQPQINILRSCINDLTLLIPHLSKTEKEYFSSLKDLAEKVIKFPNP